MKRQRGWGFAAGVSLLILLVGLAAGFSYGFKDGLAHADKYDWTYISGTGYPSEYTAAIKYGTYGLMAGLALVVVYLVVFAMAKKKGGGPVAVGEALTEAVESTEDVSTISS